jgi:hypothetical protein
MDIPASFILFIILFDEVFKCDDFAKFWGYVETNGEPLCFEFCNFVECHISLQEKQSVVRWLAQIN